MSAEVKRDPAVRLVTMVAGSLLVWFVSIVVANLVLIQHPASALLRGAMVALAVGGFAAWIWSTVEAIRAQDEFTQRMHLIALAGAFAVTSLIAFGADFMQRAGFLAYVPTSALWIVMVATWWLSMALSRWLHR